LNTGATAPQGDLLVLRTTPTGTPLWRREIDGGAHAEDDALAVTVDGAGSALVAGQATPTGATNTRFTVLKLAAANGTMTWQRQFAEPSGTARAIIHDGSAVYAAGDAGGKIVVAKFNDSDGAESWRKDLTGTATGAHTGRALALGGGRVIVTGRVSNTSQGPDFAVIALDAQTGAELWRRTLDGAASGMNDTDDGFAVAVDPAGDVVAAGTVANTSTDEDALVVKLAGATGAELWRVVMNGTNSNDDVVQAIALDGSDVFLTGTIRNRNTRADALLAKLAGANGAEIWRLELNGSEDAADAGFAIAATGGHVVVAARIRNGAAAGSVVVTKRSGASGGSFPCGNGNSDPGEACDDGNPMLGDGCRTDCTVELCGDGIRDPQDTCDDGNLAAGDCCSPTCTVEADESACDDGDACTLGDRCQQGACTAPARAPCEATDPCDRAQCNPASGVCEHVRRTEGAVCDDGNACTILDQCISDSCRGMGSPTCRDNDPCTTDACVPAIGCDYQPSTGFTSLSCLFERDTIASGCPSGLLRPIRVPLERAQKQVLAAGKTDREAKIRRRLGRARKALRKAIRVLAKRRARLDPGCAGTLEQALGDMLATTDTLRAPLLN
jgi:cysteine-rich repeat protein